MAFMGNTYYRKPKKNLIKKYTNKYNIYMNYINFIINQDQNINILIFICML